MWQTYSHLRQLPPVMTRFLQISKSVNEKECYQASSRSNGHVQNQKLDRIGRSDAYAVYVAMLNNLHRREKSSAAQPALPPIEVAQKLQTVLANQLERTF